jgi:hypothetical protein
MHASSSPILLEPTTAECPPTRAVWRILLLGACGCFVGHGAFGVITKAAWLPYFAVGGIQEPTAWQLMPWIGAMDIIVGGLALLWPCRALFRWMLMWAAWTALLRPLAGESIWEFVERAGNYGVPLALLVITGWRGNWFSRRWVSDTATMTASRLRALSISLRFTTAALLVGHAADGLFVRKPALAHLYSSLWSSAPSSVVSIVGAFEMALAVVVILVPRPGILMVIAGWKLATESLFLVAGAPCWEVIERFGSYTAPLALALLLVRRTNLSPIGQPSLAN